MRINLRHTDEASGGGRESCRHYGRRLGHFFAIKGRDGAIAYTGGALGHSAIVKKMKGRGRDTTKAAMTCTR